MSLLMPRVFAAGLAFLTCHVASALPVFPGAVGFGTNTPAGRGGTVYKVTNLNDSGPGSLRDAIKKTGPRVIVFEVSGVIELEDDLVISSPFITIAGQTAPPPGITLKNAGIWPQTSDVLIQHIGIRPGNLLPPLGNRDAIKIGGPPGSRIERIVVDHVTCSWAVDETVSLWSDRGEISNATISNSIIAHPLINGGNPSGSAGYGLISGRNVTNVTIARNLMAFNFGRNPLVRDTTNGAQIVNNFVYRPGTWPNSVMYFGDLTLAPHAVSIIGNVIKRHPIPFTIERLNTDTNQIEPFTYSTYYNTGIYVYDDMSTDAAFYLADNRLFNPQTSTWFPTDGDPFSSSIFRDHPDNPVERLTADPYANSGGSNWMAWPSGDVEVNLLASAGKQAVYRDYYDAALIDDILSGGGQFLEYLADLGEDPWAPLDIRNTRSLTLPTTNWSQDSDSDGYTDVEEWLHQMAAAVESAVNRPPVANAGEDRTVLVDGETEAEVVLDGSASFDYDGDDLIYQWSWSGGAATGAVATVTLPLGTTEITLTVDDGRGATAADAVAIEVFDPPPVVALHHLEFTYSGEPKPATVETYPEGLPVEVLYDGEPSPPIYPGSYQVVATVLDPDHPGSVSGTLIIRPTAFVRHGPVLNGTIDGSIQVAWPEDVMVNGNGAISGDLLVPGLPYVHLNGSPTYGGTLQGPGEATPTHHRITLNGGAHLAHVVQRVDATPWPTVAAPAAPAGTRDVVLNQAGQDPGDFTTLRHLTLNSSAGTVAVPPGSYGNFVANGSSALQFGTEGSAEPEVYWLEALTLNGSSHVDVVGPVVLILGQGVLSSGTIGNPEHPDWLEVRVAAGGVTLNGNAALHGSVVAPAGALNLNGQALLAGSLVSDRLTLNGGGALFDVSDRDAPTVRVVTPTAGAELAGLVTLSAEAADDGALAAVRFTVNDTAIGTEDTSVPYECEWNTLQVADGAYTIAAIARDAAGNRTESAPVQVTVTNTVRDDFEDGDAAGWTEVVGSWEVVAENGNHVYRQGNSGSGAIALLDDVNWTDYTFEARAVAHVMPRDRDTLMALFTRYSDDGLNYYTFQLHSDNTVALKRRAGGGPVVQLGASVPFNVETDRWYTLAFEANGSALNGYIDGQLVISRTDTSLEAGQPALNTYRVSASFDDIRVTPAIPE